jgi:hypothetical protein
MPSNNLNGSLPDLSGLNYLATLIISNNIIQLPLPPLPQSLVVLDLSSSMQEPADPQSGIMPDFSQLSRLTYLNISNNSLLPPLISVSSPLPTSLLILDLSSNLLYDANTGAIPHWLLFNRLGDNMVFMNLSQNSFCGFLGPDGIPPATSSLQLDLRNNPFFCPLPTLNSSLVSADCEPISFRSISPTSGPTYNNQHDPTHLDTRLLRIFADGLSDYNDCNSPEWRCRMTFVNSSLPDFLVYADWDGTENCLKCRPLPETVVGLLKIVIEMQIQDGDESSAVSDVPFGFWLPIFETSVLYCQV